MNSSVEPRHPLLEKEIEKQILMFLEECGFMCWKNKSVGVFDKKANAFRMPKNRFAIRGVSDILAILPSGRLLAIEVKTKTGRPSEHQLKFITNVNANQGIAFISRSVEQTYDQLVKFYPKLEEHRHLLRKYQHDYI